MNEEIRCGICGNPSYMCSCTAFVPPKPPPPTIEERIAALEKTVEQQGHYIDDQRAQLIKLHREMINAIRSIKN